MKNKTKNKIATTIFTFLILFASIGLWWSSTTLVDRYYDWQSQKAQEKIQQQQKTAVEIGVDFCIPDKEYPQAITCTSIYVYKCFAEICNFDISNNKDRNNIKGYYEIRILNQKGY